MLNRCEALCKADKYKADEGFFRRGCMFHTALGKIRVQRSSYQSSTCRSRFSMKYPGYLNL